ncbi:restriction endonuclease subunit S [Mycobacterium frederiksbergense]|nr:restriction endonuclease subunit S [Mycolicibacterium frederiksbergense]
MADVLTRITYGFTNPMPTAADGPYMVTAKDIRGGRIDYDSARRTTWDAYRNKLTDKSRPRVGDVLLTKDGSIGRVAVCDAPVLCINQSVALLQLNNLVVPSFLAYLLQAPVYQAQMEADSDGSTIRHIYITRVDKMEISIPEPPEQRAIVDVLSALDDKMAANEHVRVCADELSRVQWREATAVRDLVPLSQIADFVNGRAFTKGATGTGRIVVRIAELNSGIGSSTVYNDIDVPEAHLARPGDLLFAWSGSLTVARWYRPEAIVNQHIFKVIPKPGQPMWLVNQAVRSKLADFKAIASDKATTMGHIQRRHLDEPVRIPSKEFVKRLDATMAPLWSMSLAAEIENLHLMRTRDELLPLLMSGRISVKAAEEVVGGVT